MKKARARLSAIDAVEKTIAAAAAKASAEKAQADLDEARRLVRTLEYAGAAERLRRASKSLAEEEARAEAALLLEVVGREKTVLGRIIAMVEAKPVDVKRIGMEPMRGYEQTIAAADENSYTMRIEARRGEASTFESPWGKMSPLGLCRLAEMATQEKSPGALVDLFVFCRGHGGSLQAAAAAAKARRVGDDETKALLTRLSAYPSRSDGPEAKEGETAAAKPGPAADAPAKDAGEEDDEEPLPRTIVEPCMICLGSGVTKELGCAECRATGYKGVSGCGDCGGDGKSPYRCPGCSGAGSVLVERKSLKCGRCGGKGRPACLACRGTGKMKRPNPAAAGFPTKPCPLCQASGINQGLVRCKPCSGSGNIELKDPTRDVVWVRLVTCNSCGGQGKRPPPCRNCMGRGYVRPPGMHGSAKVRTACRACCGTGQFLAKCRGCAGRGYVEAGK